MSSFIIKGTITGLSYEKWTTDPALLPSLIFLVMDDWINEYFEPTGVFKTELSDIVKKRYGEVKQAGISLENDIHNLSIGYKMMTHVLQDNGIESALKELYLSNLIEHYFTNVRSIYDHLALLPRIVATPDQLASRALIPSSLNELVKRFKEGKAKDMFSDGLIDAVVRADQDLQDVKTIRDSIIHHGKDAVVRVKKNGEVVFRIPSKAGYYNSGNSLPNLLNLEVDDYPLFNYLSHVTVQLLINMERIGNALANDVYRIKEGNYQPFLTSLGGICMEEFIRFLFPDGIRLQQRYDQIL